jgi:rhodanese-related sulfurtransferase
MPIDVDREDVRRLVAAGAQLLEVLPREEYEDEHLPGAINIPLKELNGQTAAPLARDRPVVVYCNDYQ